MNSPKYMLLRLLIMGSIGSISSAVPDASHLDPLLPTVDLGYEIHQATFNQTGQYYNFSNIRYAAPPLGNLRFSAPVAPFSNITVFNDGSKEARCPQASPAWTTVATKWLTEGLSSINISAGYTPPNITTLPPVEPGTSEDCLFLDVMVPKEIFDKAGQRGYAGAPVVVWIYGGGYTLGYKSKWGNPAGLLKASQSHGKEGMIYVAMNYRIGLFGFLSGPTFATFPGGGTPNAGLLDQRFALEWVNQNIHKFGGNPNRVTLMGESAGGGSTIHQITAYGGMKGKVPFQQAISQSGAFLMTPTNREQERIFQLFLQTAGVATLQEARGLSTEVLQLVNAKMVGEAPYGSYTFNPVVDGTFAPALPGTLLLHGNFDTSIKLLAGHNSDEGLYFTSPFVFTDSTFIQNVLLVSFPDLDDATVTYITETLYPPLYDGTYGYTNPIARADYIVSEALFSCNAHYLSRALGEQAFSYVFSVPPALHGDDIYYTFFTGPSASVKNDTLAEMMQEYFTNFVIGGDPNGVGLPSFPNYGGSGGLIMDFNLTNVGPIEEDLPAERCAWWQKAVYF